MARIDVGEEFLSLSLSIYLSLSLYIYQLSGIYKTPAPPPQTPQTRKYLQTRSKTIPLDPPEIWTVADFYKISGEFSKFSGFH